MDPKAKGLAWLLALFAASAFAQSPGEIRKQAEASMLVTGNVLIEPDGSVSGWEIDQKEKLPPYVVGLVDGSASAWKFEPVVIDGKPRKAKARMSLRVVLNQLDSGDYRLAIRNGYFGQNAMTSEERRATMLTDRVRSLDMRPPGFPMQASEKGVQGTVYLVLRINRQGTVEDVLAEQVNLKATGSAREMRRMRSILAAPAVAAARRWVFQVPTTGEEAGKEYWSVRVPVKYAFTDVREADYGQWEAYMPGPKQEIPWLQDDPDAAQGPDAMIAGGVYMVGEGMKLLTPLQQGG